MCWIGSTKHKIEVCCQLFQRHPGTSAPSSAHLTGVRVYLLLQKQNVRQDIRTLKGTLQIHKALQGLRQKTVA